ncbi:MAG: WecB/TagA/CpsF family glycosyltransferase [bacterium]|nr:WecB/TagA/CpsF family glycosyltransferase [bacterium]
MEKVNILGVNFSNLRRFQVLDKIREYLRGSGRHQLVTPNAEIILAAQTDAELRLILNLADLAVMDGSGPQIAARFMGAKIERYPGADLLKDILNLAAEQNRRIAVFNWQGGLSSADDIKGVLAAEYPKLRALAVDLSRQAELEGLISKQVMDFAPDIIISTLGSPYQEKFIFKALAKLPFVKLGLGVGGGFDFLTGKIKRAPKIMRAIGLEWLWRLFKQPWRIKRIYNAVIVFTVKFLIWRYGKQFKQAGQENRRS